MLSSTFVSVILLSFLSIFSTIIGVGIAFRLKKNIKAMIIGIGFSVGIMIFISFFELLPEAITEAGILKTLLAVFIGIVFIGSLNFIIPHTHLIKEKGHFHKTLLKTAYLVVFGLILHDIPEGFAMASSYIHSPSLGIMIALAIAIHNIPEEFAMSIPLLMTKKKNVLFKAAFFSSLAEPIGAILGLFAIGIFPDLNPLFMAFAAGAMIFISIHELLPLSQKYKKNSLFILGFLLSIVVYLGLAFLFSE